MATTGKCWQPYASPSQGSILPWNHGPAPWDLIGKLNESLKKRIKNPKERIKFVVASYNSGLGHISDAIALAEKYGLDPELWEGNVSEAVLWKSKPKYFNDPVVRNGYFRGRETVDFVDKVLTAYRIYTRED